MSRVWGREETTGWPTRQPAFTITAFLVAAVSVVAVWCYRYETVWTPLERYWYPAFANMHLMHGIGAKTGTYQLLGKIPMGCEVAFLDSWNIGPLCFWREIVVAVVALDAMLACRRVPVDLGRILSPSS